MPELCFLLAMLFPPVIIFWMRPSDPAWQRAGRLVLAAFMWYLWILFLYYSRYIIGDHEREMFLQQHPECKWHACEDEPPIHETFGIVVIFICGWIPAIGYSGIWEAVWRFYYRHSLRNLDVSHSLGARIVYPIISGLYILIAIPCFFYFLAILCGVIWYRFLAPAI